MCFNIAGNMMGFASFSLSLTWLVRTNSEVRTKELAKKRSLLH